MKGIKRRILRLEAGQEGVLSSWIRKATDEELEGRLRNLLAKFFNCEPKEVDMSSENLNVVEDQLRAPLGRFER